jgi:very-short-patch-repair endonuclease
LCWLPINAELKFVPPSSKKSELERRFEKLFSEVFRCDWQKHLQDEYHVQVDGKNYYIDYVCITQGRKIAIEVDGHDKIKGATDSTQKFHDLLARQNDLMSQGFEVYRFGWNHVVSMGGWRARRDLKRIFKGIIQPQRRTEEQKRSNPLFQALPVLWTLRKSGGLETHNAPAPGHRGQGYTYSQSPQPDIIEAEILPYQPPAHNQGMMKGFVVGVSVLGCLLITLELIRGSHLHPEVKPEPPLSQHALELASPSPGKELPQKKLTAQRQVPIEKVRTVYVPVLSKSANTKPIASPVLPTKAPMARMEPNSEPIPTPIPQIAEQPPQQAAPIVDEIVAFNQSSGIYHRLHCTWAKRCRHCITIHQSEAEQMGGRPAKSCDPL